MSKAKIISDVVIPVLNPSSLPDRSSPANRAARREIKRMFGIPVSMLDYAAAGTTNWSDALNEAIVDVGSNSTLYGTYDLLLPTGNYDLPAMIQMDYPVQLIGRGLGLTVLQPTHSGNAFLLTGRYGTCPRLSSFSVFSKVNMSSHIYCQSYQNPSVPTQNWSPDFLTFDNLNLTALAGTNPAYNIVLDGNGRQNDVGGTVPIGLRSITLRDCVLFSASFRGLDARHTRVATYSSVHVYGGGGVGGVAITGPSASILSYNNIFFGCALNGVFSTSNSVSTKLYGSPYGSLSLGANLTNFSEA